MVFIKHNSLKSDIFFDLIFIPGFLGSRFFSVQVFQGPGFSGSGSKVQGLGPVSASRVQGPRSGSRVRVQVLEVAEHSHVSQFTYHLRYYMFLRVILNYVMFMLISNEPIKVADLQKLANQLMQNGALVIEMVNNSFSESKKNFGRMIKRGTF